MVRTVRGPTGYEVVRPELPQDENGLEPRIQSRQEIRNDCLTEEPPYEVPSPAPARVPDLNQI